MLRIDGERKRQGRLRLRVARGQSRGQNAHIYRKIAPAVRLGGIAPLANYTFRLTNPSHASTTAVQGEICQLPMHL